MIISAFLSTIAFSCSKGGGSSAPAATTPAVQGTDATGTYNLSNIQCYNASLTTLTHATTYVAPHSDQVIVTGNSFTETLVAGACTTTFTGNILINSSGMSVSNLTVGTATGGSCIASSSLNGSTITPTSNSVAYTNGQSLGGFTNASYIFNTSTLQLGILSIYTDGSGGYCFIVYQKQ